VKVLTADRVAAVLAKGAPADRPVEGPPRFEVGQAVCARNMHPATHTRIPRYVRGHRGIIDRIHGAMVFPDSAAIEQGEKPQYCYSVKFRARELWGQQAGERDHVYVDLWDDHLEPA